LPDFHRRDRRVAVASDAIGERGGLDIVPLLAQWLDDRRRHQTLDPAPRRELGAELAALARVEGLLQKGAEDRGLDVAPVRVRRLDQEAQVLRLQRQGCPLPEQAAVELE
jgi:hypothetical protein